MNQLALSPCAPDFSRLFHKDPSPKTHTPLLAAALTTALTTSDIRSSYSGVQSSLQSRLSDHTSAHTPPLFKNIIVIIIIRTLL